MSPSSKLLGQFALLFRSRVHKTGEVAGAGIASSTKESNRHVPIIGGDFAGLSATFDPRDGSFIPVPEQLVPDELLQWGQAPKTLQVLASETVKDAHIILRNNITVFPEIGCAIDSLGTRTVDERFRFLSSSYFEDSKILTLQYATDDENIRLETIFGMDDKLRMRVVMDLIPGESSSSSSISPGIDISRPMVLLLERRASSISSSGQLADGLDARTVSEMLGPELRKSKTFVDDDVLEDSTERDGLRHLDFPGNVGITYGWQQADGEWVLEVSHVHKNTKRVACRHFQIISEHEVNFCVDSRLEDISES
jgi:hypothetical protein